MINETHRRLTSHIGYVWIPRKSVWFPSFIILPPSIPPLHLGHRTFLNRCRPLLHDDLHGDIWAQLGTCPDIARITNNPPELLRKIQVSNPTHGLLRPFTKRRSDDRKQDQLRNHFRSGPASMLCHGELYCVMGSCIVSSDGTRCAGLRTPNLRVSHAYEIGQLFDSASKLFKQPNWGNKKAWINRHFRWSTSTLLNDWC